MVNVPPAARAVSDGVISGRGIPLHSSPDESEDFQQPAKSIMKIKGTVKAEYFVFMYKGIEESENNEIFFFSDPYMNFNVHRRQ
jgi:hypothetical protein